MNITSSKYFYTTKKDSTFTVIKVVAEAGVTINDMRDKANTIALNNGLELSGWHFGESTYSANKDTFTVVS